MAQAYAPGAVVRTVGTDFFAYRGVELTTAPLPEGDAVVQAMDTAGFVRLDGRRREPRGPRDRVVALVLASGGPYARHGPQLRTLLARVDAERAPRPLDELLVVAEEELLAKKNIADVVAEFTARQAGGADPAGAAPFYTAAPYHLFCCNLPANASVPPHRLMSAAETAALLAAERLSLGDLPAVPATDPPVVWLGGRRGQVVEILRASQTGLEAPYYRRII